MFISTPFLKWLVVNFYCFFFNGLIYFFYQYEKFISSLANEDDLLYNHLVKHEIIQVDYQAYLSSSLVHNRDLDHHSPSVAKCVEKELHYCRNGCPSLLRWFLTFFTGVLHHNHAVK